MHTSTNSPARAGHARHVAAAISAAAAIVLATAVPGAAAPPSVYDQGTFETSYTVSAQDFPCGVDATFHEDMTFRFTAFVDGDGVVVRRAGHIGGTTTVTTAHGQVTNRWRENAVLDPVAGTISWSGNSYNVHGGAGGILVNTSGHWVLDAATDEPLFVAGPDDDPDADPADLCAVLAP